MNNDRTREILFVINPLSGSNQNTTTKSDIAASCKRHQLNPHFYETTGENDEGNIGAEIAAVKPYGVVAVGGDGTVNLVAALLIGSTIKLGIIPTGSANGMTYELKIPSRIDEALAVIGADVSKHIDLLRINKQQVAIHLSDVGMNARIIRRFDQDDVRGLYGYARQFFKEIKSPSHFRCTIVCDRQQRSHKYKAVMIAMLNTHFFGTGAMVNPTGKINDGLFEIVVIKPYPWYYIFHMVFAFFTGNIHRLQHVRTISCQHATIELQSSQDLQVDGEPIGQVNRVEVEILPSAIEVYFNNQEDHLFLKSENL